jgi:hypothetical protein
MVAVGLASVEGGGIPLWQLTAVISGPMMLLSAGSASGSLMLARMAEDRALIEAGEDVAEVGITEREAKELLGGRG